MDVDDHHPPHNPQHHHMNAVAGPSSIPDVPTLYLPPPGPPRPPPYFTSTEDLLKRFQLLPSYDKYVRPFAPPVSQPGATDKGKGKEIPLRDAPASSPAAHTPAAGNDGEDEEGGKGEKKFKNYKHLIKSVPGKHSMKKDDYLATLMQIPPKQKTEIKPFTQKTSREAFSVSLDGLKGWNIHTLVAESSQAREDRKRRKELKKLAKAQGQAIPLPPAAVPSTPSGVPATPGGAPTQGAASAPAAAAVPPRSSTPRPGAPKLPPAHQQPPQPRGRTPVGIGTPQSVSTPGPTAAAPPTQPAPTSQPPLQRGVKREREREESGAMLANGNLPPVAQGTGPGPGMGQREGVKIAKAGVPGARPRPVKKQRLDSTGPAQVPFQQPTPHA